VLGLAVLHSVADARYFFDLALAVRCGELRTFAAKFYPTVEKYRNRILSCSLLQVQWLHYVLLVGSQPFAFGYKVDVTLRSLRLRVALRSISP
jgi:hypothetical protein